MRCAAAVPLAWLLLSSAWLWATASSAQVALPDDRPSDERLDVELLEPGTTPDEGPILPPYPIPIDPTPDALPDGVRVFVREIVFEGATVVPIAMLERIASGYEGRALDSADLLELRDRVTLLYVDQGYLTSGAVLPDQSIADGLVQVSIVEGMLTDVEIETDGRFREWVLRQRLESRDPGPVNVHRLEARLQALQADRRIERVQAELVPDKARGTSRLRVRVLEAPPYDLTAVFDNYRSPSIGSLGGGLNAQVDNLVGIGDAFFARGRFSEGLRQLEGHLAVPISRWGTLLSLEFRWSDSDVVAEPINSTFDIETRSRTIGAELRQPLFRSSNTAIETFLRGELRRSNSYLDGTGVSFTTGPEDGLSKVTALRWGLEWTTRTRRNAFAFRSLLSLGVEAFDATSQSGGLPDGQFLAWLGQAQWAHRLTAPLPAELIVRSELQVANSPLLPLEQMALGGRYSVRGYRENTLVRDNGFIASAELRVAVYRRIEPAIDVEIIPFVDVGHSWNANRSTRGKHTLASIGIGTQVGLLDYVDFELFVGHRLKDVERIGESDLQDSGVHFRVSAHWP